MREVAARQGGVTGHRPASTMVPTRFGEAAGAQPAVTLPPAATDAPVQLMALERHNALGQLPLQNGIGRVLTSPASFRLNRDEAAAPPTSMAGGVIEQRLGDRLVWTAAVKVEGAAAFRTHLAGVRLPVGSRLFFYAPGGEAVGPVEAL